MNRTLFWRLAWKEYRTLRAFWIALAVSTLVLQLMVIVTIALLDEWTRHLTVSLFGFGLGMVAFYALGCGATLFAIEREDETYHFLRTLPVTGAQLMRAKLNVAAGSIVALWAVVYLESTLVCGLRFPDANEQETLWGALGLAAVEALVWGMFFSLMLRRPMTAVFAAAAAVVSSIGAIIWLADRPSIVSPVGAVIALRILLVVVVLAADVWLARRWLDEFLFVPADALRHRFRPAARRGRLARSGWVARPEARRAWISGVQSQTTPFVPQGVPPESGVPASSTPSAIQAFVRLFWQGWRQSRLTMIIMTGVGAALVVWVTMTEHVRADDIAGAALSVTVMLTALAGGCAFQSDQSQQRFRFLAERGVRPSLIWLSRHLVWLVPLVLWAGATALLYRALPLTHWETLVRKYLASEPANLDPDLQLTHGFRKLVGMALAVLALSYAAGQFCSIFVRRGVVAAFSGLILAGALFWWAGLMWTLEISWLWSVAPIPLMLLVATWLRTSHWLVERTDRRARRRAALSIALPALVLVAAVIAYRVYQIPYADPGIDVSEFAQPISAEEKKTAGIYLGAAIFIQPDSMEPEVGDEPRREVLIANQFVARNRDAIKSTLEANARPDCSFFDRALPLDDRLTGDRSPLVVLGQLLTDSALVLEDEGQLDAALDRYFAVLTLSRRLRPAELLANQLENLVNERLPGWAARPGQTPERIKRAIDQLQKFYTSLPPTSDWIEQAYVMAMRRVNLDPQYLEVADWTPQELRMLRLGLALVPWEKARSRRLVNLVAAKDLDAIARVEAALANGAPCSDIIWSPTLDPPPKKLFYTTLFSDYKPTRSRRVADTLVSIATRRRATLILLALEGWKAEHGELPKSLDELVGPYLERLALDPYSGQPFRYFPQGLPERIWTDVSIAPGSGLQPNEPLIWSTGEFVRVSGVSTDGPTYILMSGGDSDEWAPPMSEHSLWFRGRPFRIP